MTNETAIKQIEHILYCMPKEPPEDCKYLEEWFREDKKTRTALEMAIESLRFMNRDEMLDVISRKDFEILVCCREKEDKYKEALELLLKKIEEAPVVCAKERTGHWISFNHELVSYYKCDICGEFSNEKYRYCPHCGSRILEETNEIQNN